MSRRTSARQCPRFSSRSAFDATACAADPTGDPVLVRRAAGSQDRPTQRQLQEDFLSPSAGEPVALRICGFEDLVGGGYLLHFALELSVEPVMGHHRLERSEYAARLIAPGGHVGELPPPQRLVHPTRTVVPPCGSGGRGVVVVAVLLRVHLGQ